MEVVQIKFNFSEDTLREIKDQYSDKMILDLQEKYLDYLLHKLFSAEEIDIHMKRTSTFKKISKRNFSQVIYNMNLEPIAYSISITPDQLAANINNKSTL